MTDKNYEFRQHINERREQFETRKEQMIEDMDAKLASVSELALANRVSVIALTILITAMNAAYIFEAVRGDRSWLYTIIVCVLGYVVAIVAWIVYRLNKETEVLKHILGVGYGFWYTFLIFTAHNELVFTYGIPLLIVITLYNDNRYTLTIGASMEAVNIASVVKEIMTDEHITAADVNIFAIKLVLMALTIGFFVVVSATSAKFQKIKMARLNQEKNKTAGMLDRIIRISDNMTDNVYAVTEKMVKLEQSVNHTIMSMSEVTEGTNDSAESIQSQLLKTEDIQNQITKVKGVSDEITEKMDETSGEVTKGKENIESLMKMSDISQKAGNDVADALMSFNEYTKKMNSIIVLINDVASQTSLLALNASIEAARAGETGKGFAVVATEISNLADQTQNATENITDLIGNINEKLEDMKQSIDNLIKCNQEQSVFADRTVESFETISDGVGIVEQHSYELKEVVSSLDVANKVIVDSIQTISAITEQVSAHSNETYSISEENKGIVEEINTYVSRLNEEARALQEIEK